MRKQEYFGSIESQRSVHWGVVSIQQKKTFSSEQNATHVSSSIKHSNLLPLCHPYLFLGLCMKSKSLELKH